MNPFSLVREEWKNIYLGDGFTNEIRLEVSNHGRIRSFNKINNGKIIKGSVINGYPIVRIRLFKPRDEKVSQALQGLQFAYLANSKKITDIKRAMRGIGLSSVESISLNEALELEMESLKNNKSNYNLRYRKDIKNRTIYFGALVHRMVAEQFIRRSSEELNIVAHLDYDKHNNKVTNLKWMTIAENMIHQQLSPHVIADKENRKTSSSNSNGRTKLSVTRVMYLKKLLNEGKPIPSLARQFKVTETQIIRIKKEENWASVKAAK